MGLDRAGRIPEGKALRTRKVMSMKRRILNGLFAGAATCLALGSPAQAQSFLAGDIDPAIPTATEALGVAMPDFGKARA